MKKLRYFWKGEYYFIDLYEDNTIEKFTQYETRNKTSKFEFCIGLTDKNGKEIYDGDFARITNDDTVYIVSYHQSSFVLKTIQGGVWVYNLNHKIIEVIGNIHENLELLQN